MYIIQLKSLYFNGNINNLHKGTSLFILLQNFATSFLTIVSKSYQIILLLYEPACSLQSVNFLS